MDIPELEQCIKDSGSIAASARLEREIGFLREAEAHKVLMEEAAAECAKQQGSE